MAPRAEVREATTAGARGAGAVREAISSSPQGAQNWGVLRKDSRPGGYSAPPWASISSPPVKGGFRKNPKFCEEMTKWRLGRPTQPRLQSWRSLRAWPPLRSACSALRLRLQSWVLPRPKASRLGLASPYAIWCHQQNKRPGSEQQCGASRGPPPYQRASRGRSAPSAALAYLVEDLRRGLRAARLGKEG